MTFWPQIFTQTEQPLPLEEYYYSQMTIPECSVPLTHPFHTPYVYSVSFNLNADGVTYWSWVNLNMLTYLLFDMITPL
jgi:hypothetical protein